MKATNGNCAVRSYLRLCFVKSIGIHDTFDLTSPRFTATIKYSKLKYKQKLYAQF